MGATAVRTEDWLEHTLPKWERKTGSLGSEVLAVRAESPPVLQGLIEALSAGFRKSWCDLAAGLAVFMAPSRVHEFAAENMAELVKALCLVGGDIPIVAMRATTMRTKDEKRKIDPDESFLVGERAARFLRIESGKGTAAALAAFGTEPPDLAIEVEHTHYDSGKPGLCRAAGVRELWELAADPDGSASRILDLQAPEGVRPVGESRPVPGVCAVRLRAAAAELRRIGGLVPFTRKMERGEPVVKRLLAVAGTAPSQGPKLD